VEAGAEQSRFEPSADPAAADALGHALAARVGRGSADLVCVWEEPEDGVLGHVMGLALGTPWVRCVNADGLVALLGNVPAKSRCVIAMTAVRAVEPVMAIRALVERNGGRVVSIATLLWTEQLEAAAEGTPTVSLAGAPTAGE
jgi:hypothetical protein